MEQYQKRIVAFFDILGFSELIKESAIDPSKRQLLFEFTNELNGLREIFNEESPDISVATFSDSVIVTINPKYEDNEEIRIKFPHLKTTEPPLFALLQILSLYYIFIQLRLNLPIRGGVVIGDIYHNNQENRLFGPALVEAYGLEQKKAIFPRVIFSQRFIEEFVSTYNPEDQKFLGIKKDFDNQYFLDHLEWLIHLLNIDKDGAFEEWEDHIPNTSRIICKLIQRTQNDISLSPKALWYSNYFNNFVNKHPDLGYEIINL